MGIIKSEELEECPLPGDTHREQLRSFRPKRGNVPMQMHVTTSRKNRMTDINVPYVLVKVQNGNKKHIRRVDLA